MKQDNKILYVLICFCAFAAIVVSITAALVIKKIYFDKPKPQKVEMKDFSPVHTQGNAPTGRIEGEENTQKPLTGEHSGIQWVDLGLPSGTKWATCNMGASSPDDFGSYVTFYEKEDYLYSGWHVPSYDQAKELVKHCSVRHHGNGYTFTGPNGMSIHIPSAGYCKDDVVYQETVYGDYWTNTPYNSNDAWEISWTDHKSPHMNHDGKHYQASVRPVLYFP